jgi:hypothetical protein
MGNMMRHDCLFVRALFHLALLHTCTARKPISQQDARLLAQVQAEIDCRRLPASAACPRVDPSRLDYELLGHRKHSDRSGLTSFETSIWMLDARAVVKISHAPSGSTALEHWRNEMLVNQHLIPPLFAPPWNLPIAEPLLTRDGNGLVLLATARLPIAGSAECRLSTRAHLDAIVRLLAKFHAANWDVGNSTGRLLSQHPGLLRAGGTVRLDWPNAPHGHREVSERLERAGNAAQRWLDEHPARTLLHGDVHAKNFPALRPCAWAATAATGGGSGVAGAAAEEVTLGMIDLENAGFGPCMRDFVELVRRTGVGAARAAWLEPLLASYADALGEALGSRQIRLPSIGELRLQLDLAALEAAHRVAAFEPSNPRQGFVPRISAHIAARALAMLDDLDRGEALASEAEYTAAIIGGRRTRPPHTIAMGARGFEGVACRTLELNERCQ